MWCAKKWVYNKAHKKVINKSPVILPKPEWTGSCFLFQTSDTDGGIFVFFLLRIFFLGISRNNRLTYVGEFRPIRVSWLVICVHSMTNLLKWVHVLYAQGLTCSCVWCVVVNLWVDVFWKAKWWKGFKIYESSIDVFSKVDVCRQNGGCCLYFEVYCEGAWQTKK